MILVTTLLLGTTFANDIHRQFVGNDQDVPYTISCTDKEMSPTEGTVELSNCAGDTCPDTLSLSDDMAITVTNFPAASSGSTYDCKIGDETYPLMIGVLVKPNPSISPAKKTTFEAASDGSIELARCDTGYGQPAPSVVWLDQNDDVITTCDKSNADDLDTKQCITDAAEDNPNSQTIELVLFAEVQAGEGKTYTCQVTYSDAENGEKVQKTTNLKFPAEGCISVSGEACPGDTPASGPVRAGVVGPDDPADPPTDTGSEEAVDEEPEEDSTQMHNALLGTATGIVIFAIIVILIWFIRKKNRESEEHDDGYKAGEQADDSGLVAQQEA